MTRIVKFSRIISIGLLLLTAVNALIAGTLFIIDPSGEKMGMSVSYLAHSPFSTFLIPGITLFVVNGIMNIIAAIITIKRLKHFPLFVLIQGLLLSGWIIIQVILVKDFNVLHFSMLSVGVLLMLLGSLLYQQLRPF
jgi:hypothetical protein